jgi:predicted MFS family arabinose efflux permease
VVLHPSDSDRRRVLDDGHYGRMFTGTDACVLLTTWIASGGVINGWGPLHSNLLATTAVGEDTLQIMMNSAGIALSIASVVFGVLLDRWARAVRPAVSIVNTFVDSLPGTERGRRQ